MKRFLASCLAVVALIIGFHAGALFMPTPIAHAADATSDTLATVGDATGLSDTDPKIIVGNIIRTSLTVLGILLVCIILYGGFLWMTADGNPEKIEKAKKVLINAIIGLVIILLSWSITTFVLQSLLGATGGTGGSGGSGGSSSSGTGLGGGSSSAFTVTGFSPEGGVSIRNIVPRITFSKTVDSDSIEGNITITDASGTAIDGAFSVSGNVVKFVPTAVCPDPNTDRFCFAESSVFTVTVSSDVTSKSGTDLTCDTSDPCSATFTSGTLIDTQDPTASITYPESSIPTDSSTDFQVYATDDAGVSSADFSVDSEWKDSVSGSGSVAETIATTLDTTGFTDGTRYTLTATVIDFAGNEDFDSVSVRARPEWCFNGVLDETLGETGIDCGGDSAAATYCGACDGSSCTVDSDCSSGSCVEGVCVSNPVITDVSPQDGAVGTYVTITGTDFGSDGSVFFTDSAGTGTVEATVLRSCGDGWQDTQVIVDVPAGAGDGPITIVNADDVSDATNDDSGVLVPNFDVNDVVHPSLCTLSRSEAYPTSALTVYGSNFGSTQGDAGEVLFSSTAAGSYTAWGTDAVKVTVPQVTEGEYHVSVVVDGQASNTVALTIVEEEADISTITDIAPESGGIGQYVTLSGTNFGASVGTVTFTNAAGDTAIGSVDFPSACSSDYWKNDQVIIIVPETFNDASATPLANGAYTVTVTNREGVTSTSQTFTVTSAAPTPGICSITSSADVGDEVVIIGDSFGVATDTITFYDGVKNLTATTWGQSRITAVVPSGAVTGPVTVTVAGRESNAANLTVGATSSSSAAVKAAYAWAFSTGEIYDVPQVVSECSVTTVSAVPNNVYSEQDEICVNAVVYAEFTTLMNEPSAEAAFTIEKCTAVVASATDNPCTTTAAVSGTATAASSTTATRVTWIPDADFDTNSTYRVTVATSALSSDSVPLAKAVTWDFTTSTSSAQCVVDRVTVTPARESLSVDGETTGFGANAGTGCVVVDSSDYTWDWSLDRYSYVDFNSTADATCVGDPTACATLEALAEGVTEVTATALNPGGAGSVSDSSTLTVNFTDPYVESYAPNCIEACTNALVYAEFNTAMTASTITTGDNILLYQCSNELCTNLTFFDANPPCTSSTDDVTRCDGFAFDQATLTAGEYYRVIVSGDVTSESGVGLIRLNYGSDFSWTFRVREDGTACAIERITMSPSSAEADAVGETTAFTADAFGAADSCSTSGQKLAGAAYTWNWTDPIPDSTQNTETTGYTAAFSTIDGKLFDGGPTAITEGCSSLCTPIGSSPYQAVCGDGVLDRDANMSGEECDDGNTTDHDGCSSTCVFEGSNACSFTCSSTGSSCSADSECVETCDTSTSTCSVSGTACTATSDCAYATATCRTTGTNCCANNAIEVTYSMDIAESCDDGNLTNGDGCSATCLAEGSASVSATCGNNDIAADEITHAGEVCDDGNNVNGDGCSRLCLAEGSHSLASLGGALCGDGKITTPYETCDDGNTAENDGCSSICIREGSAACPGAIDGEFECCGNALVEQDAATDTAENGGGEDCDPAAGVEGCSDSCTFEGSSVAYGEPSVCGDGFAGVGEYASCESSSSTGDGRPDPVQVAYITSEAVAEVSATTNKAIGIVTVSEESSSLSASADFTLSCGATTDEDCSDPSTYGVGIGNCCVPRPELESSAPIGSAVCRNAAIYGVFSEQMDRDSFTLTQTVDEVQITTPQMYVQLNLASGQSCPEEYTTLALADSSFFAKVFRTIKTFFFGAEASAASTDCIVPISGYTQTAVTDATTGAVTYKVAMNYSVALEASSSYTLMFVGDTDLTDQATQGITSALGGAMKGKQSITFTTGTDICTVDAVTVEDTDTESSNTFTTSGEAHTFTATAVSYTAGTRQEITEIPTVYDWTWSAWASSDENIVTATQSTTALDEATVTAKNENGKATVTATVKITADTIGGTTGKTVSGTADVLVLLCKNPWPALSSFPWTDDGSGDTGVFELPGGYMNFSMSYCKDYLDDDVTTEDLPDVNVVLVPTQPSSTKVLKEYLFEIDADSSTSSTDDNGDVIGVRILSNAEYLSPMAWYTAQGFTGSPSETTIDGFQAVEDERSTYVGMANSTSSGLYSNIFVISYNAGASSVTQDVYKQMVENLTFLANIADEDDAAKIARDVTRLADVKDVSRAVTAYSEENDGVIPVLSSGTAVRSLASSGWSSWTETLGGALGIDMPTDPLNTYAACDGYDSATCVEQTSGAYMCPEGSYVYHYRAIGSEKYELATELEYTGASWVNPFDSDSTDAVTFYTSSYCDGDVYGTSSSCGDGIIGTSTNGTPDDATDDYTETCEIGDVYATSCVYDVGVDGISGTSDDTAGSADQDCNSTCSGWTLSSTAVCSAPSCGNGVIDATLSEECDDGAKNGEYGYCGDLCKWSTARYCGDGVISGGEACDCGSSSTTATATSKPYTGTAGLCAGYNGTYAANPNTTCAWDCAGPASYCGDTTVDSAEECDATSDTWGGALCCGGPKDGDPCSSSSDCPVSGYCGYDAAIASGLAPFIAGSLCSGSGDLATNACEPDAQGYETARVKTCEDNGASGELCVYSSALTWEKIPCETAGTCGDGVADSNEECDDGNDVATDDCTTECTLNTCGDGYLYDGVEECDEGTDNGAGCDSAYDSTCTACSTSCYYTTASGEFCGDGVRNGPELCDGAEVPYYWFNMFYESNGSSANLGECNESQDGLSYEEGEGSVYTSADGTTIPYVFCSQIGMCNGGGFNGDYCRLGGSECGSVERCTPPVCAESCAATCPLSTTTGSLLLTTNEIGARGDDEADVYSYSTSSTSTLPNAATITIPACTVSGNILADIDFSEIEEPDVYVVFVTDVSGSMKSDFDGNNLGTCRADSTESCSQNSDCPVLSDGSADVCENWFVGSRLNTAVNSINTAITDLFDELGSKAHIGLVHYSTSVTMDSTFLTSSGESTLQGYVNTYDGLAGGYTETWRGFNEARTMLDAVTGSNVAKIIVFLSDGQPTHEYDYDCADEVACANTHARKVLQSDIELYSIALTSDTTLLKYMNNWSSNTVCESTDTSFSDCDRDNTESPLNAVDYSQAGSTEEEIEDAYSAITESLNEATITILSSDGSTVATDTDSIRDAHNISLPWPSNFACDGVSDTEIPVRFTFRGEGKINISNVRINYCAP